MTTSKTAVRHSTDNCCLEYVEGYLACSYNHQIGEECLMHERFKEERPDELVENEVYDMVYRQSVTV